MNSIKHIVRAFILNPAKKRVNPYEKYFPIEKHAHVIMRWLHSTPFFVLDRDMVKHRLGELQNALNMHWGAKADVAYSFKTNYAAAELVFLRQAGVLAEVVSSREYALAQKLGYEGKNIIFNGPVKTDDDLYRTIMDCAIVHIDNASELRRFVAVASSIRRKVSVGMRVRGHIRGVDESRFGFSIERGDAIRAVNMIMNHKQIHLNSVHLHPGTDLDCVRVREDEAKILARFCLAAESIVEYPIPVLDVGGGFPSYGRIPYEKADWDPLDIGVYIRAMSESFRTAGIVPNSKRLIVEPGRYLVDDAVVFATTVVDQREARGVQEIVTNGSVTMLPLRYYRPQIVRAFSSRLHPKEGDTYASVVYGGSCREDDVLYEGALPRVNPGDLIVYYCAGAYNQSMGSDFIFGKPAFYKI